MEEGRAAERFLVLSRRIFRVAGICLVGIFLTKFLFSLLELRLRNPALEMRFISQMAEQAPWLILALALLFCHPRHFRKKLEAWFLLVLRYLAFVAMVGYVLAIPITMNAASQLFRNNAFQVGERIKTQLEKAKKVQETVFALSFRQQEEMVARYNRANPDKPAVDTARFLKLMADEISGQETKLEEERTTLLRTQKRRMYLSQFIVSCQCLLGALGLFLVYRYASWVHPTHAHHRAESKGKKRWSY